MKDSEKPINTEVRKTPKNPAYPTFYRSSCIILLSEALVEVSLPLSPKIVATDTSLYDNEGAVEMLGVAGGRTKDESCSKLRDPQIRGTCWNSVLGVPGRVGGRLMTASFAASL